MIRRLSVVLVTAFALLVAGFVAPPALQSVGVHNEVVAASEAPAQAARLLCNSKYSGRSFEYYAGGAWRYLYPGSCTSAAAFGDITKMVVPRYWAATNNCRRYAGGTYVYFNYWEAQEFRIHGTTQYPCG